MRPWLPSLLWSAVILFFSGDAGGAGTTAGWLVRTFGELDSDTLFYLNYTVRKGGHVLSYAILGALNLRALRSTDGRWTGLRAGAAVALAMVIALLDEGRQTLSAVRTPSVADLGFDFCGAALAVMLPRLRRRDESTPAE